MRRKSLAQNAWTIDEAYTEFKDKDKLPVIWKYPTCPTILLLIKVELVEINDVLFYKFVWLESLNGVGKLTVNLYLYHFNRNSEFSRDFQPVSREKP